MLNIVIIFAYKKREATGHQSREGMFIDGDHGARFGMS